MPHRLLSTYDPLPISFSHGEGAWIWDKEGNRYLDGISGFGVNILGYGNTEWINFVQQQSSRLVHVSNMYLIPERDELAERVCAKTGMDKVFFTNSGSEANECAIKLARLYGHQKGIHEPTIVVFDGAFHGRTIATLTASGLRHMQAGFEPLASGFLRAPFDDINALKHIADNRSDVVAVMFEPIQGAGGINLASPAFLQEIRALCDKHQWLMISDEVQTGVERTGEFLTLHHYQIEADIVTLAKALGNGIPIGACLTKGVANDLFTPEKHGSTQGGNPFVCAVANKTLEIVEGLNLVANARQQGQNLLAALTEQFAHHKAVKSVRGQGLMLGIEMHKPCKAIAKIALEKGLLVNIANQNVIRLLPPLVIQSHEVAMISEKLGSIIDEFAKR